MNRKSFLLQSVTAGAALVLPSYRSNAQSSNPEPYKPEIVREFVGAGHNKLERVKEMLAEYPNLVYSRWDWGQGDFEEAIEGAGHVGNREIAEYLIQNGARPNMFVMAMLGETEIVKSMIARYPSLLNSRGAHGYTLLHHATRGGEPAKELLEYLKSQGLKEMRIKIG